MSEMWKSEASLINMLDILYEDDVMLAVNKAAGVVVHPTYRNVANTLLDAVRTYGSDWPKSLNPTIVGRLDRQTSGVVIVAKSSAVHAALQRILADEKTEKIYLAVVRGEIAPASGTMTRPLAVDPHDRRRMIVAEGGAPAETRFRTLAVANGAALVECRLITGRRHQIRVHLSACGCPILGDAIYGAPDPRLAQHALHAAVAAFRHPADGRRIRIAAPPPDPLVRLITDLGLAEGLDQM